MNRLLFAACLATQFLALGVARSADATEAACADKVTEEAKPEAAQLVSEGKEALKAARYEDAMKLFERAYCLAPVVTIRHPLSAAALNLGRCDDALLHAQYWKDNADQKARAEAERWLHEVKSQCVQVSLTSIPVGASVRIDGPHGRMVVTPWSGFLRAATHTLTATMVGRQETLQEATLPRGERKEAVEIRVLLPAVASPEPKPFVTVVPVPPPASQPLPSPAPVMPLLETVASATGRSASASSPPPASPPGQTTEARSAPAAHPDAEPSTATVQRRLHAGQMAAPLSTIPARDGSKAVAGGIILGLAAVAAVVAAVAVATADKCPSGVVNPVEFSSAMACQSTNDTLANASWGIVGAAAVTGTVLLALWGAQQPKPERARLSFGVAPNGLALNGSF